MKEYIDKWHLLTRLCDIYSIKANAAYTGDLTTMLLNGLKKLPPHLTMFSSKKNGSCHSQIFYKLAALKNLRKVLFTKFYKIFQDRFSTEQLRTTSSEFEVHYEDLQGRYR